MKHTRSEELRKLLDLIELRPELNGKGFISIEGLKKELESAEGLEEIERKLEGIDPNKDILRVFSNETYIEEYNNVRDPLGDFLSELDQTNNKSGKRLVRVGELQMSDEELEDTYNKYQEYTKENPVTKFNELEKQWIGQK